MHEERFLSCKPNYLIAEELEYIRKEQVVRLLGLAENVGRALNGLINSMTNRAA
jgi:hypothetical protein